MMMRWMVALLSLLNLAGAFWVPTASAEVRVALVVGNSAYKNVSLLDNPANDARLLAETLRGLGFKLVGDGPQLDLDKAAFDNAVQSFGNQLQGADVGLFYYAGHGVQIRGTNYLVPVNANPTKEADVDFQMLDANLVLRQMEGAGTKLNIVILDACRNNPFGGQGLRTAASGLAQMQAPEGTLISFATQPGNVAQDGTDGDSPYTEALVQTIRRPGLDIFRTFNEVGLVVANKTGGAQQPWVSLSPIKGNFYFANPTGPTSHAEPTAPRPDPAFEAWNALKNTNSQSVLRAFIAKFGDSIYAELAKAKLEDLIKKETDTPTPDEIAWNLLRGTRDANQLKKFLQEYPNSPHRGDAEEAIKELAAAAATSSRPVVGLRESRPMSKSGSAVCLFFNGQKVCE
jgi:Caspase domain